ncbi:MAG: magnesium transporter [Candidatus Electrothrix aestuarii]|uniref:Magnesium transporter MgtE n=2 Tax=Candidatus Electrothrix TaxID=1859128 RepID=A0AAU8LSX1_9BACT|nr:magnesium transporter [Candidatus Electrothrix aestuarii]WPD21485.1 MAG: magnesium transporter [Candidatus Electrothrix sp. GW3-3]
MEKTAKREMIGFEGKVLLDTLRRLHRKGATENLLKLILKTHPADLAWVFRSLPPADRKKLFEIIANTELVADFFSELDDAIIVELAEDLTPIFLAEVISQMAPDDAADMLDIIPHALAADVRKHMERADRDELEELLKYDPETAGGIMSPDFMYLDENLTVEEAIKKVQKRSEDKEMVFYLYITHGDGHLTGVLSLRELLLHPMHRQLKNIMNHPVISVTTDTDQSEVAHIVSQYNLLAIPVVDATFKLIGIITVDDVIDVIREEATEDFLQMAGAGKDNEILLKPLHQKILLRAPWLFASWIGGIAAMFIINGFEHELQKVLALASFIPIIAGMGGNIATQSSTIVVRGMATGRVNMPQFFQIVGREALVGIVLGLIFGILLGLMASFQYAASAYLGIVVGLSVCIVMIMAASLGTMIPMLLKRFHVDAAIATGPFITTSIDVLGISLYFSVAKYMLKI